MFPAIFGTAGFKRVSIWRELISWDADGVFCFHSTPALHVTFRSRITRQLRWRRCYQSTLIFLLLQMRQAKCKQRALMQRMRSARNIEARFKQSEIAIA